MGRKKRGTAIKIILFGVHHVYVAWTKGPKGIQGKTQIISFDSVHISPRKVRRCFGEKN